MNRRGWLMGLVMAPLGWAQNKIFREPLPQPKFIYIDQSVNVTALVDVHSVLVYERGYTYADGMRHLNRYEVEVPKGTRFSAFLWPGDRVFTLKGWRMEPIHGAAGPWIPPTRIVEKKGGYGYE